MQILLGADHAGFKLKELVKAWLRGRGYAVHDEGAFKLEAEDDYPDFIHIVAKQVSANPEEARGIIFGGSGQGEAMVANRYKRVRAAVYYGGSDKIIVLSREHNNANILSIGARFVSEVEVKAAIELWLATEFTGAERHARRIGKIDVEGVKEHEF
jgi:ribose 5-phosphate isomerase B